MAKQTIDSLLAKAKHNTTPASRRVAPKTLAKIESDLSAVVEAEAAGKPTPTYAQLIEYIAETYSVTVSAWSVKRWMQTLRRGESL